MGISDFSEIRQNGYYYVDKSALIEELPKNGTAKVTLITRPRRLGKTLGMDMLARFFDIRRNNRELFQGLEIEKHTDLCQKWMNQYPVLFLSFKDVDGTSFENALELLKFTLLQFCDEHSYLEDFSLGFAVITGCLRIAKESIFTGTNNFVSDSIASSCFQEYFGFTQREVDRILQDADREEQAYNIKT